MQKFKIALLQLAGCETMEENRLKGIEFCKKAKEMGADLALFPEMWSNSYNMMDVYSRWYDHHLPPKDTVTPQDEFVTTFKDLAKELDMAICITFYEAFEPLPKNSLIVFDRHGEQVIHYSKVHTCDFGFEFALTPGDDFYTGELDTAEGKVMLGAMICYDREFPESARILMLKGAEIIITPNACELEDYRLAQYKVRSFENCVGMAMANYAAPNENGHSVAFDGVAFGENGRLRDMTAVLADEKEGIFMAEFDMDKLREARKYSIWGDAYRRPSKYAKLLDMDTLPVFDREELNRR